MDKKDFSDLEDQIISTVNNALKAIDFADIKNEINNKTDYTINKVKTKINLYSEKYINLSKKTTKDMSIYINKKPAGKISGIVYIVLGTTGTIINTSSAIGALTFKTIFSDLFITGSSVVFGTSIVFLIISVGLLAKGINLRKRIQRFNKYVKTIGNNSYILIKDLAQMCEQKENFIIKDLSKMIEANMFLEGHIDEEKTYFIINDEIYREYLNLKKQEIEEENNRKIRNENINSEVKDELESVTKTGNTYIQEIKNIKNKIPKEEIATKLEKLIKIATQILNCVEKNPKKVKEVNKFINHYLPITIKLISSYEELNNQLVQGDNIKNAKIEIEKSIDLINHAFENLLDDLFEDIVIDISTDISVLETLFKQEGLTDTDFKK